MRRLKPSEVELRVAQCGKSQKGAWAVLLAYKTARVDMDMLDEEFGAGRWQNAYKRDTDGILQCGIGVKFDNEWIWKWSNGTESNQDKEKGEYSDAFKRAGFMWGIGRELYHFPRVVISLKDGEWYEDQGKMRASIRLSSWHLDFNEDYSFVRITDNRGVVRFEKKQ